MHRKYLIALSILTAATAWAESPAVRKVQPARALDRVAAAPPTERFAGMKHLAAPHNDGSLKADFTVAGADALAPVMTENFDATPSGWTFDDTKEVTWKCQRAYEPGNERSFSNINPDDVASLFVEGPYQTYKRECSSATSPAVSIPANGKLSFWLGFSLNYDDVCRLLVDVVAGQDTVRVWDSSMAEGEKPWSWRFVEIPLDDYAGRDVNIRLTYGPGSGDMFETGGYLGDFYIDDFTISGMKPVESIDVITGDKISLKDISEGAPVKWQWAMPGAVPESSEEQNPEIYYTRDGVYDISLTVSDAAGNTDVINRKAFVNVTGTAPTARIGTPASFRNSTNRLPLIAPFAPVTFFDASTGYPDSWKWSFSGVDADPETLFTSTEETPEVAFSYLHEQNVALEVANGHGSDSDECRVSVEYSAVVNNLLPDDRATNFDMEDWGMFPGSNTRKITAYAERFSRPSRPVMIDGAYVFFSRAEATELVDQIANVGVHLYTSENGKPGKKLDSMWWSVFELDVTTDGSLVGTSFPFTETPVVDDEFFIVVDGLPEFSEGCCVSFGMADFRSEGNTAMMLKEGEWIEVPDYFGADKHTSFMIYPSVHHSVMSLVPADSPTEYEVDGNSGSIKCQLFSYLGYKTPADTDCDWLRLVNTPNGMTLDDLEIAYDAIPEGTTERTGHLTLTDGASSLTLTVHQKGDVGIDAIAADPTTEVFTLSGLRVSDPTSLLPGLYIVRQNGTTRKILVR